jgi:hypothetical protein
MNRVTSRQQAPALLWIGVALVALLAPMSALGHLALATAAILAALTLAQPNRLRLATALAMLPVAIDGAPAWSFVLAGGLLASAMATRPASAEPAQLELIQRHLEWCRRRDEPAHLLWVHAPSIGRPAAAAALDAFRVTDNVALLEAEEGFEEIVAMMDDRSFERTGLERRLRAKVGEEAGFGWATFPDDGLTLEALFEHARQAAIASARPIAREAQVHTGYRRWEYRPHTGAARSPNQG